MDAYVTCYYCGNSEKVNGVSNVEKHLINKGWKAIQERTRNGEESYFVCPECSNNVEIRIDKSVLDYLRSIIEPIAEKRLDYREVVYFCIKYFVALDETIAKLFDSI